MRESLIYVNFQKTCNLDQNLILQEVYYRSKGSAKKMWDACMKAGYKFTLAIIKNWLNKQALHQIHKLQSKFI